MRLICCIVAATATLGLWSPAAVFADAPTPGNAPSAAQLREAVNRSLPYLEKAGLWWMEEKKCVTCHRVSFLSWTFNDAAARGFEVDRQKLQAWVDWSATKSLERREGKPVDGSLNLDGVTQLLLGHAASSAVPLSPETTEAFLNLLVQGQQPDGSWKAGGQLPDQKRPKEETAQVSTMWNTLALASQQSEAATAARRRALDWLATAAPGQSAEWHAARLLLHHKMGDESAAQSAREHLKANQHADGGWGWLLTGPSDALATGQALYALSRSGVATSDSSLARARQFLIASQQPDGSWPVHGTKEKKKDHVEETATYWGTAWATLGLLQTLP